MSPDAVREPLPLGAVRPRGWLERQLRLQADGQTGRLEEMWPDVGPDNAWLGGDGDDGERGPYYLDGLVPLAWLLDDAELQRKARRWVDAILGSQRADGFFGPAANDDWWPRMVAIKALCQYAEATGDERVVPFLTRYFEHQRAELPVRPLAGWGRMRGAENALGILWLHARAPQPWLLELARTVLRQTADWEQHLLHGLPDGPAASFDHLTHGPNVVMALKLPAVRRLLDGDDGHLGRYRRMRHELDRRHGLVNGLVSGDEWLAGRPPWHGTETCQVVEHLFSLERLAAVWDDAAFGDELELVAFNALAAGNDAGMRAHQYHQQPNQVLVSFAHRGWTFSGDDANVFGLEPHYGCCTANLHQGWPKFTASLWLRSAPDELTAVAYAPCAVSAPLGGGEFAFAVETEYPFEETVRVRIDAAPAGPVALRLRVPGWCTSPRLRIGGDAVRVTPTDGHVTLHRTWRPGDLVELELPMAVRLVERDHGAVGVRLGPLVLVHGVGEVWRPVPGARGLGEWEITPRASWNFGLWPDRSAEWTVQRWPTGPRPFEREQAPVRVLAHGARLPEWRLVDESAGPLPPSPVRSLLPIEHVELVPYGSARLRVTEFPVIAPQGDTATGHGVYA